MAPDDLWVLTKSGAIQEITASAASVIAAPETVVDLDGSGSSLFWMIGKSGKLYRRVGDGWTPVPVPSPTYSTGAAVKAKEVRVLGPDDVLLTVMYWEKELGWTEEELHTALFRTRPATETLRCNEPDPEQNTEYVGQGFHSWPPWRPRAAGPCSRCSPGAAARRRRPTTGRGCAPPSKATPSSDR